MSLQSPTIQKLMHENFSGEHPTYVTDGMHEPLAATINARIVTLNNVTVTQNYYRSDREKTRFITAFTIEDSSSERYYRTDQTFRIITNEQNELTISGSYNSASISDIEELFPFIAACQERMDRHHALNTRRQKVRDLKAQAIIARVKKLAKAEKFDFATDTDTQKLKLYVRLSQKECIELYIPFSRFEEVLPNLRTAILSLRELYEQGIRFKPRSTSKIGWRSKWISHESIE